MVRTETATVVFTDLVGSTELANRLGHDAYEAMRRTHFNALRLAASQCRGTEIKSTGDGMVFSFGSAGDALACMIRMQQTTDLAARRNGGDPRIWIGASCGEISREDHDIFGISVVEAARLLHLRPTDHSKRTANRSQPTQCAEEYWSEISGRSNTVRAKRTPPRNKRLTGEAFEQRLNLLCAYCGRSARNSLLLS